MKFCSCKHRFNTKILWYIADLCYPLKIVSCHQSSDRPRCKLHFSCQLANVTLRLHEGGTVHLPDADALPRSVVYIHLSSLFSSDSNTAHSHPLSLSQPTQTCYTPISTVVSRSSSFLRDRFSRQRTFIERDPVS